ncbi:hypothetical protein G6F24_018883 [Rhizopus arrhizus]|nr:hypothetical protein G6F24_018883 [Rhizopus arrhizus]
MTAPAAARGLTPRGVPPTPARPAGGSATPPPPAARPAPPSPARRHWLPPPAQRSAGWSRPSAPRSG